MAVGNQSSQSLLSNSDEQIQSLERMVRELQAECGKLREALAKAESERETYRQLFLQEARERREFEDLDIPRLERMSSGPVEKL
jgi:predicted RNase H-like nuclease (RuvC/YqgF family)